MATKNDTKKRTVEYEYPGKTPKRMTYEYPPGKTVSEWLAWGAQILTPLALIVPIIALIVGINQFKLQQSDSAAQSLDQQRQTTLDTYLDRVQDLLLKDNFYTNNDAKALVAARTFTVLRYLDGSRKAYLIRFLYDVYLMGYADSSGVHPPIINVYGFDLSSADFATATSPPNLRGVVLNSDNLYGANLSEVDLRQADLGNAYLQGANLQGAKLEGANLKGARYNTNTIQVKDVQGNPLTLQPTQWPQGFDPKSAGSTCVDC